MLSFGMTMNCIPWVYVPEILPLHVRAKGTAVGISANWIWNFFVVMITPTLLNSLAWKGYLIFMCLNYSFIPLVVRFFHCTLHSACLTLRSISATPKLPILLLKKWIGSSTRAMSCVVADASRAGMGAGGGRGAAPGDFGDGQRGEQQEKRGYRGEEGEQRSSKSLGASFRLYRWQS
jgi:hypothetical protein